MIQNPEAERGKSVITNPVFCQLKVKVKLGLFLCEMYNLFKLNMNCMLTSQMIPSQFVLGSSSVITPAAE